MARVYFSLGDRLAVWKACTVREARLEEKKRACGIGIERNIVGRGSRIDTKTPCSWSTGVESSRAGLEGNGWASSGVEGMVVVERMREGDLQGGMWYVMGII